MASFKSSHGVCLLLATLLVCQAFIVPSLARTQVVIGANKMAEPQDMVTPQGYGGHGHGDVNSGHRHGEDNSGHGGSEYGGHGHKDGGHDGAGHRGGHD